MHKEKTEGAVKLQEQGGRKAREEALSALPGCLCPWFEANKRQLPWRDTGDPYDVWISEIMLQQTRVEAVKGYFLRFREALPDIAALAACPEDRLLKLWEGLGYYSRARNLKKCAGILMEEYGGRLPADHQALLKLPGIGPYTAGAIASIAFGLPVPAVDGNVLRVRARIAGDGGDIALPETKKQAEADLKEVLQAYEKEGGNAGTFNQALMELGAIVCVPNGPPLCERCPAAGLCAARREGTIGQLPVKSGKKPRRIEEKTVVILQDGDRFLIQKRPAKGLLAGLYEFPSLPGFLSAEEVLAKVEGLGLEPVRITALPSAKHIFTHVEWRMQGYLIKLAAESRVEETLLSQKERDSWIKPHRFATREETESAYALPSAFAAYAKVLQVRQGMQK